MDVIRPYADEPLDQYTCTRCGYRDGWIRDGARLVICFICATDPDPEDMIVPGSAITCGNRTDLPRKQRRHLKIEMGMDTRNRGTEGFGDVLVHMCTLCGRDLKG